MDFQCAFLKIGLASINDRPLFVQRMTALQNRLLCARSISLYRVLKDKNTPDNEIANGILNTIRLTGNGLQPQPFNNNKQFGRTGPTIP